MELFHGYTYSAHPVACAAALATLKIFRDEDIFAQVRALTPAFLEQIGAFKDLPYVTDTRGFGLLGAVLGPLLAAKVERSDRRTVSGKP